MYPCLYYNKMQKRRGYVKLWLIEKQLTIQEE